MGKKKVTAIILAGLMALGFTTLAGQDVAASKAAESVVLIDEDMELEELIVNEGTAITIAEGVTVTISGNFTFNNCDFTMEEGSSLTVLGTMSNAGDGTVTIGEGATLTMGSSTTTPSVEALLLGYTYTAAVADDADTEDVDESEDEIIECTGEVTFTNNGTVNIYCASLINGTSINNGTIYTNSKCNSGNKTYAVYKISITGYDETRTAVSTLQYQPTYFAGELTNYGTITAGTWTSLVIDTDNTYNYGTIETTNDKMVTTTPAEMRGLQLGGNFFNYEGASLITRSCAFYKAKVYNWGYLAIIGATLASDQLSYLIDCENTYGNYFYSFAPMLDTVIYSQLVKRICLNVEYSYNEELVTDSSAIEFSAVGGGYPYVPDIISDYNFVFCNTNSSADGIYYTTYITEGDTLADLGLTISGVYYINAYGEKVYFDYGEKSLYTGVYSATSEGYETKYRYYCEVDILEPMTAIVEVSCIGDHSWDAGVITTAATCETDGVLTYSCANCDATKEEAIPATGHSFDSGVITTAATCEAEGVRTYSCTKCDATKEEAVQATGHSFGSGVVMTAATTSASGLMKCVCAVCGKEYTDVIAKLESEAVGTTIKDASGNTYVVTAAGSSATVTITKASSSASGKVTIPATVTVNGATYTITAIGANAYKNNKKITSITIGNNVTSIGASAFQGCTKLKKVTVGKNVKTIGKKAFYKCTALTTFTCKSTALVKIGASAFQGCKKLKTATFKSKKLTTIGKKAFYGCKKLSTVTFKSAKLTKKKIGAKAFTGIKSTCKFKVPKKKMSAYKTIFVAKGAKSTIKMKKA